MNVFDLVATITLDSSGYDSGLSKAGAAMSKVGGAIKTGFATIAKVGTAALGAASAGVIALTKASVDGYAEYEQMVGGVKKLYGNMGMSLEEYAADAGKSIEEVKDDWQKLETAQNMVLENAKKAYKTAGMSANQYMETATSFSASLIKSLGGDTVKAAEQTDKAMQAISDNFNTFGGDIGMIQGAFQGFAKQNYTMLDNLKLGYGGTKEEMKKLIADANEYAKSIGEASDLSIESFSDIVTAIDLIQRKQHIWGTTSREATTTIAGSLGMAKAAWENLVTGFSDKEADLDVLFGNLVDSIVGYTDEAGNHINGVADNIIPAIETALSGVGQVIERVMPVITEKLPSIIENTLPSILNAAASLVAGIVSALPSLLSVLIQQIPPILAQISTTISENSEVILTALRNIGGILLQEIENLLTNVFLALQFFDWAGAAQGLAEKFTGIFDPDNPSMAQSLLSQGISIIKALATGLTQALPELLPAAIDLIAGFVDFLTDQAPSLLDTAVDLVISIANGLTEPSALSNILQSALNLIMTLVKGLLSNIPKITEAMPQIIDNIVRVLTSLAPQMASAALEIMVQLGLAVVRSIPTLIKVIPEIISSFVSGIIDMASGVFKAGAELMIKLEDGINSLNPEKWGRDLIDKFVSGIKNAIGRVKDAAKSIAETVKQYIGFSEPELGPLSNFHTFAPDMMKLFAKGIADNDDIVANQLSKSFALPELASGSTTSGAGGYGGNIYITVNGAEGQSEEKIAEIVSDRLLQELNMERAAWGTV